MRSVGYQTQDGYLQGLERAFCGCQRGAEHISQILFQHGTCVIRVKPKLGDKRQPLIALPEQILQQVREALEIVVKMK